MSSSEVLQRLFEDGKSPLSESFLRWKLWNAWPDYVGPSIAKITEPVGFQNGMLWVWVKNASWMQQLFFMRKEIQATIQKKMGHQAVKAIRFTLDRKEVPSGAADREAIKSAIEKVGK